MKIRNDFVTNSSSSSFLLSFTSEDAIKTELVSGFDNQTMRDFPRVFEDVLDADRLTREDAIEKIYDELEWEAYYRLNIPFDERHSEGSQKKIKTYIDNIVKSVDEGLNNPVLVEVEYSDHSHADLEQEVMPNHPNTLLQFSHH